jgi:DNA-binding transcriptional regulator LsrR (DeoR family)
MALQTKLNHIRRLTALILRKATGTPELLAQRLNISESTLFALLKFLRDELNVPIHYDADRQSYCFSREGKFFIGFMENKLYVFFSLRSFRSEGLQLCSKKTAEGLF